VAVNAIGSAWKTNLRTGALADRDYRLYIDPRGLEYPDLGTGSAQYTLAREDNLIDRGNCELGIAPMIFDETVPVLTNATFARSTDFAHTGDYSYKFTKTVAAGTSAQAYLVDTNSTTDMHGLVAGSAYAYSAWAYIPTASGISASEVVIAIQEYTISGAAWSNVDTVAATTLDAWQKLTASGTISDDATGIRIFFFAQSTAALNEYFYIDDVKLTTHNIPGTHYLSDGYIETLNELPDKGTIQIGFLPRHAYDTASAQTLKSWRVSATQFFTIGYAPGSDTYQVLWIDGGTVRALNSAQYDDGTAHRNIAQKQVLTLAYDLTTGTTAGSSLWMNKTQDDITWSGNIDAKTTVFNKSQTRALAGTEGENDILYDLFIPNVVATDADVQNDFKDIKDEQQFWSLDGHGTGRTRCNVTEFLTGNNSYKGVTSKSNASQGANQFNFRLKNLNGEFSDDQNAAWDPANSVYNGTNAQNYLQRRFGVIYETWYSGDFDTVFTGRLVEAGLSRESYNENISYVNGACEDGIGDIDRSIERYGRVYEDLMLVRSDTLIDRGSCESSTPPAMFGETTNTLSNATFARGNTQVYLGRFSYTGTKTIAAGTAATITLADSVAAGDMHGFLAGETYTFALNVWLPSGAMLGSEFVLALVDSAGSTTQAATNSYDQWQTVTVTRTMDAGATYAYPQIQIAAAAAINEVFYVDSISIVPANKAEATARSLLHNIASRSDRYQIQYAANNSFENTTIGDTWLVTAGGTLNKDAADGFIGSASAELIPGAAAEQMYSDILFTGTKKLNIGDTYTWQVFVKSTVAASGADNYIEIDERDSGGSNDTTQKTYTLAGGEDYKSVDVQHTITDGNSDRLRISVGAAAGDTINIDAVKLIQSDRALDYFEENTDDGTAGEYSADNQTEISWPWFGYNVGNADYIHPWRRQEIGTTDWENLKSIANSLASRYFGMSEEGTLTLTAVLDKDYNGEVIEAKISGDTDFRQNIGVALDGLSANKLVVVGTKYEKSPYIRLIWRAVDAGNFNSSSGGQALSESVIDDAYWPDPSIYPEYWAEYGATNRDMFTVLTGAPQTNTYTYVREGGRGRWKPYNPLYDEPSGRTRTIISQSNTSFVGSKVSKSDNIVGIKDADLIHKLADTGEGQGGFTEITSGTIINGLDVTSRAGQARILLRNELSATKILTDAAIVGKPVYKFAGADGYVNDDNVDYESILKDGERLIEAGGEDVIDGTAYGQLDRLADFFWKDRKIRRHIYSISFTGTTYDIQPAEWYRLTAGQAGTAENIDSTVEVLSVRTDHKWGSLGTTVVTFRELLEPEESQYLNPQAGR
jgi:hypothetical protein